MFTHRRPVTAAGLLVLACVGLSHTRILAQPQRDLTVVSAGPTGEIAALAEANEVRVVFSEPMVVLGRIPEPVRAPFFRITPAVEGTFRWSGTTILIFTPAPGRPLPYATRYTVTLDTSATAISRRKLARPYTFTFTTPTVRLLATDWIRSNSRYDRPLVVALRFNQPVRAADVAAHLRLRFEPHAWTRPSLSASARERLRVTNPQALAKFDAKVATAALAASQGTPVEFGAARTWDQKAFPPAPDLVVVETRTAPPTESWIELTLDAQLPSPQGPERPGAEQRFTIELEPTFFVNGPLCAVECDPSSYNPIQLRRETGFDNLRGALSAVDVTDPKSPVRVQPARQPDAAAHGADAVSAITLEEAGFNPQPPARTYAIAIDETLRATDGQTLGYTWLGIVENWHERPFTSFGDGHGVWETGGGTLLPFYARNFRDVAQWAVPLAPADLMPRLAALHASRFQAVPPGDGLHRPLAVAPDQIQSFGLDVATALSSRPTGLVWAGIREGRPIPRARPYNDGSRTRSTIVQVTNLGITVKDSPQRTLALVTRLDTGDPVPEARVWMVDRENRRVWEGTTNGDGVALAPGTSLRKGERPWESTAPSFLVFAEKNGDVAYAASDWNEGIQPWEFGNPYTLDEAEPLLRGAVFTDRGVYKLGEEVHLKAILRLDAPDGIRLLDPGTTIHVTVRDTHDKVVDRRTVKSSEWSSADWTLTVPADGSLGSYWIRASLDPERPVRAPGASTTSELDASEREREEAERRSQYLRTVNGSFLVAAYRRPDFRTDVTLGGDLLAGGTLSGVVTGRYLFGAPMVKRPVKWSLRRTPSFSPPRELTERFTDERFEFVGSPEEPSYDRDPIAGDTAALDATGQVSLDLETTRDAGVPYIYTLEADVEDVSRQHVANRSSVHVHPAPWYVGIRRPPFFVEQRAGFETAVVAVTPDGKVTPGVPVALTLTQVQWHSVRRAEGSSFYGWETERREVEAGTWAVTTADQPVPVQLTFPGGGLFVLEATARDDEGRSSTTRLAFYVTGPGYTAWTRYDHNRIDLVAERATYRPGETARIMIQSPWEHATALLTTEREGIRSHERFALTSTQHTVDVPIRETDIPNLYVSVLLVKGRTKTEIPDDGSDPGKPSFRLGYVHLKVDDRAKRLDVAVTANQEEYRPGASAQVNVEVKDAQGQPVRGEVTLWAVDHGVLSLTAFSTPNVLSQVYIDKALQVMTVDSRQRIVSRRVLTPKGTDDGGGGGADPGAGTLRKDFRVLAFWLGSLETDARGRAQTRVTLPESLTTYRVMAVAADKASRFGSGESEIRINKPVTLRPAFPRFLAAGDQASFGAVVTNQLKTPGTAIVTIESADPGVVAFGADTTRTVQIAPGGSAEVRFEAASRTVGSARVRMRVRLGDEGDAFEDAIPVEVLAPPETVAAYGDTQDKAVERLAVPAGVVTSAGGLHVELSSTAMVGLGEGARYLVEYPYDCAEQRASRALALLLTADLGEAFSLPDIAPAAMRATAQSNLTELKKFQCPSGGFAFWPGDCMDSFPYLTSYLLHVFDVADSLKYTIDADMRERAYSYLEQALTENVPGGEGWWPYYTAWQAFAVKVLAEGGRNQDSNVTRLYGYRDRMPVFALAHLLDALAARGDRGPRVEELKRRIANAVFPEGGSAHVEELNDPYLMWFWNSNIRSTAIVLGTLVRQDDATLTAIRPMVRWLISARTNGRWRNTQENAWALEALVRSYRRFESQTPDFTAVVTLGAEELARERFDRRSTGAAVRDVAMPDLLARRQPGSTHELAFAMQGTGTLFYATRLRYVSDEFRQQGMDNGIGISRTYTPLDESGAPRPPTTSLRAGDLVRVNLVLDLPAERRFVAVTDPLPAGLEPVDSSLATTATDTTEPERTAPEAGWRTWWARGGFDHVERHDDRVRLFATRLAEGRHEYSYLARATTAGTFRTAPSHAEQMYEPEVFGRTASVIVDVQR
jgi:uncharacterized protein YfaS (alpha-2-macroglobulin family)